MDWTRLVAVGGVVLTGVGLTAVAGGALAAPGIIVALATLVLGLAFAVGGVALYGTDVESGHLLRVAGWNGLGHGGDSPSVTDEAAADDDTVRIAVLDDGEGIPERERELINEGRTETALDHSSGLGLWLTKWIAETYDGDLTLDGRGDEGGGRAVLRLPAA
jgi:hypothetical protein